MIPFEGLAVYFPGTSGAMDWKLLILWIGIAWLAYTYVGYPLLLVLITRFRRIHSRSREDYLPTVSVLIAARNEQNDIGWKIVETLGWDYPSAKLEVLVASDASVDRTDEIVNGIQDPRVKLIRMERRGGKGRALNRLAHEASGVVLFFTDANAHIPSHCIRRMVRHLADERVGCVTGRTSSGHGTEYNVIGSGAGAYFGYESRINSLEDKLGSVLNCDGAIFCMRRSLYIPVTPDLANDLELPLRVRHAGYWTLYEPEAYVLERDTESPGEEFARRRRIAAQGALACWKLRETLRGWRGLQFLSHKLFRYLTPVPLFLIFATSLLLASRPLFAALLSVQIAFYLLAAVGFAATSRAKMTSRVFSIPFYVVFGSIGALMGIVDACTGRRFDIWNIATQSRGGASQEFPGGFETTIANAPKGEKVASH